MAADTITVPRETAVEAMAFLEAIVKTLGDLGADTNELFDLQSLAYEQLASAIERDSSVEKDDAIRARSQAIADKLTALLDLNIVSRVTALEGDRDEFRIRLGLLEDKAGWKQAGSDA